MKYKQRLVENSLDKIKELKNVSISNINIKKVVENSSESSTPDIQSKEVDITKLHN